MKTEKLLSSGFPKTRLSFSGHETFPFRYTWLKKAVDAISEDPEAFSSDEAMVNLGVGKNMVDSIKHWALATDIIEEGKPSGFKVTDFGEKLLLDDGWDPYLEDAASLWLLHWKLCAEQNKATTWYYVFSKLTQIEFTREQITHEIEAFAASNNYKKSLKVIERDVDCLIRTYVPSRSSQQHILEDSLECPLTELSLILEVGQKGLYSLSRGYQRELPDEIFTYALLKFWERHYKSGEAISFEDIAYKEGSPGQVFKIDEDSLAHRLEKLEKITEGNLRYDETSALRQVYISNGKKEAKPEIYLKRYYKQQAGKRT